MSTPCRSCAADRLEVFYRVDGVPTHSCLVVPDQNAARNHPRSDIALGFCHGCGLIQNTAFEPDQVDYGVGYEDSQAHSARWVSWASELIADLVERRGLRGARAVEIGCGKGDFLALLASVGDMEGIGYDPAFRPGPLVDDVADGLSFHTRAFAPGDRIEAGSLVCFRHVLEHVADTSGFLTMIRDAVQDTASPLLVEVPSTERILDECAFWDVYYEHCTYFTAFSLRTSFERAGFRVESIASAFDDQYLVLEATTKPAAAPVDQHRRPVELARLRAAVRRFGRRVPDRQAEVRALVETVAEAGGTCVLWGAGSKAVGCLTTLGISDGVTAVVDIDPAKQGGFLAGSGHPVVPPDAVADLRPDRVIAMNLVYVDEITRDLASRGVHVEVRSV